MIRGGPIIAFMLCLGAAAMAWQMSGIGAIAGPSPNDDLQSGGELEQQANESVAEEGFDSEASTSDGDLVGVILSGVDFFAGAVGFVTLLPFELNDLGLPWYGAYPIGLVTQVIIGFAFVQAASGRVFR